MFAPVELRSHQAINTVFELLAAHGGPMLALNGTANQLLAVMPAELAERIFAGATLVDLVRGVDLVLPQQAVEHCWFPLSGLLSLIALDEDGEEAEVGLIGSEGMADVTTVLGDECGTMRVLVQVSGAALRIDARLLKQMTYADSMLTGLLLGYMRALSVQIAFSALAYARFTIPRRLARWLLMASDRLGDGGIELTHDALAIMLAVRRAGVTVALQTLAARGYIDAHRGRLAIRDRNGLLKLAGSGYGGPEAEYRRLMKKYGTPSATS